MDRFIPDIRESIKNISVGSKVYFSDKRYSAVAFSDQNFHKISGISGSCPRIVFVDGGNAEIIASSHISLSIVRVCAVLFQDNKKKKGIRESFSLLTTARLEDRLFYSSRIFGDNRIQESDLHISSTDPTIKQGIHRASISSVANMARRFAELALAKDCIKSFGLEKGDIILLDGTLQASYINETRYLNELYEAARREGVIVAALAKTSSLLTDSGNSAQLSVLRLANMDYPWFYFPVVNITHPGHHADLFFSKLHGRSRFVFRIEIHSKSERVLDSFFSSLADNSKDPVFFGYPYGLIVADRLARISNYELSTIRSRFRTQLGKDSKELFDAESTSDAHSILDNIG